MKLLKEINEFTKYCKTFYNDTDGVYPIATNKEIENAIREYILKPGDFPIEFDSIDREQVREIIGK